MTQIDAVGALQKSISFPSVAGVIATVAVITHPSILGANLKRRRYKALAGHAAEVALLSDAYRICAATNEDLTVELGTTRWPAPLTQKR